MDKDKFPVFSLEKRHTIEYTKDMIIEYVPEMFDNSYYFDPTFD